MSDDLIVTSAFSPHRFPNAFVVNSDHSRSTADSSSPGDGAMPVGTTSPVEADTLKIEEVHSPATGTRKAKVLYDYDAADSSELSLLADEVGALHGTGSPQTYSQLQGANSVVQEVKKIPF